MTMTATKHDDQLGEIYSTMLNELNYTVHLALDFHVFIAVAIMVMVVAIMPRPVIASGRDYELALATPLIHCGLNVELVTFP